MPLKGARPRARSAGSPGGTATASYPPSARRYPAIDTPRGAEQCTRPPFVVSGASRDVAIKQGRGQAPIAPNCSPSLAIPSPATPPGSPLAAPSAAQLECLLRRHLEELRFTFGDEPLDDLQGFLICEDGNRALITARDLDPAARSFLYLHCLGHLALGHVDGERLSVSYELRDRWRLPPHEQAREAAADDWALELLACPLAPTSPTSLSLRAIRRQLGALHVPHGFLRACLHRLRAALTADPTLVPALQRHAATLDVRS